MMKQIYNVKTVVITWLIFSCVAASAQTASDSLSLREILTSVMNNYPAIKKAEKEVLSANARIDLSKTAYLPEVNFSGSYTRMEPVNSMTMPIGGEVYTIDMSPKNIYSAGINLSQNIYDFGRTKKSVELNQNSKLLSQMNIEQIKQQLSLSVARVYYTISYLEKAIQIKDDQLKNLNEHLNLVQKKNATGSATQYDILTTKVKISTIENQKTDLQTSLEVQTAQLNSFLGNAASTALRLKEPTLNEAMVLPADSLIQQAYRNRSEIKLSKQTENILNSKLGVTSAQNNPSFNLFANGGYKNGYFSNKLEDTGKWNYAAGVTLKVPIFDANRTKYSKVQVNNDISGNKDEMELIRRNITNEVVESRANLLAAANKVKQSELQLQQAQKAYELSKVNYEAGSITNLDLLDSFTSLSESKLSLYKAITDYEINSQKLKISVGEKIY